MVRLHKYQESDLEPDLIVDADTDEDLSVHVSAKGNGAKADKKSSSSAKNDEKVYFMALGGLEHVGQNMYLYKYRGKFIVVDCGMGLRRYA